MLVAMVVGFFVGCGGPEGPLLGMSGSYSLEWECVEGCESVNWVWQYDSLTVRSPSASAEFSGPGCPSLAMDCELIADSDDCGSSALLCDLLPSCAGDGRALQIDLCQRHGGLESMADYVLGVAPDTTVYRLRADAQ